MPAPSWPGQTQNEAQIHLIMVAWKPGEPGHEARYLVLQTVQPGEYGMQNRRWKVLQRSPARQGLRSEFLLQKGQVDQPPSPKLAQRPLPPGVVHHMRC
jgi:hypothetical protein